MSELATLARPYAQAIFEIAQAEKGFPETSQQLGLVSIIVSEKKFANLIGHPKFPADKMADAIVDLLGETAIPHCNNFIRVLAVNGRLPLLPEIAAQFEHLRANAENRLDVQVTSAHTLDEAQQQQLRDSLTKRFNRDIQLDIEIDESLLSGAIVRAGDQVIDGSARGRLERLQQNLVR